MSRYNDCDGEGTALSLQRNALGELEEGKEEEEEDLAVLAALGEEDGPAPALAGGLVARLDTTKPKGSVLTGSWRQWRHPVAKRGISGEPATELGELGVVADERNATGEGETNLRVGKSERRKLSSQSSLPPSNRMRRQSSVWDTDSFFNFGINTLPNGASDKERLMSVDRQRVGFLEFTMLFFRDTACHGVPRIVQKDVSQPRRLLWLVLFLAASSVLLYETALLITQYLDYGYQVNVEFNFNKELNFPSVTLCNLSPLRRSALECSRFDPDRKNPAGPCANDTVRAAAAAARNMTVEQLKQEYEVQKILKVLGADSEDHLTKVYDFNQTYPTKEEYSTMGFRLEDMLVRCTWKGNIACSVRNFTVSQNSHYGNCFSFNVDRTNTVKTSQPGPNFGLVLELFIDANEESRPKTISTGLRMSLHQVGVKPFPEEDGFNLSPGFSTSIGVRQLQVDRLGEPYGNCTAATSEWESLYPGYDYSKTACIKSCLANAMFKQCGCVEWTFLVGKRLCLSKKLNFTEGSCIEQVRDEYRTNKLECPLCFNPCVDKIYHSTKSLAAWPAKKFQKDFKKVLAARNFTVTHEAEELFRERYLRVEIYFEELNYENIIQKPSYEVENLLADIGGQLGLWIGLSVLAFLEVVEYLIYILLVALGKVKMPIATLDDSS